MEKKTPASKSPYEVFIPKKKRVEREEKTQEQKRASKGVHAIMTEEELMRNEAWHGKKKTEEKLETPAEEKKEAEVAVSEPEEKKMTAAELREARVEEEKQIAKIAQYLFEQRMQGVDTEGIDKILAEKNIKPWTPEAQEFMEKWDWEQAEKIHAGIVQKQEAAIETVNGARKKQHIELSESQEDAIAAQLVQFNIKPTDLGQVGGFDTLTYGQRLLVIENLRQATLGRIQEEAVDRHRQDVTNAKWYGKLWKNAFSKMRIARHERETAHDIMHGGLAYHTEVLERLAAGAETMGLDVAVEQDGSLAIQYLAANELLDPAGKEQVVKFNAVGQTFSKLPAEWSFAPEGSKERKEYDRVLGEFEQIKRELLKKEATIFGDANAMHAMANAEFKIRSNQFFNTHPNALNELASIESDAVWKRGFGDMSKLKERGAQMSIGAIGRAAGASLLGKAAALPIVGGVIGGIMARKRAEEALVAQEKQARGGGRTSERFKDMMYATMPATQLRDRLERDINAVRNYEHDPEQLKKHLGALQVRLEYTTSKMQSGRVDLGSRDVRVGNQYDLFDAMGAGWALLEQAKIVDTLEDEKKTGVRSRRLDKLFAKEHEEVEGLRDIYKGKEARKGMVIGATFSLVGYFIAQEVMSHGGGPGEPHGGTEGARETMTKGDIPTATAEQAKETTAVTRGHRPKVGMPKRIRMPEDIPTGPQIMGEEPSIDADTAMREAPIEGITSPVPHVEKPTIDIGTLIENRLGMDAGEYGAIKETKVETLLKQIPSRDEAWAIWRGEVPGSEITLPHDGIYGAMEFKKHIDLAEYIRSKQPNAEAMHGTVSEFMRETYGEEGFRLSEDAVAPHGAAEAHPVPGPSAEAEDIPTGPQIMEGAPLVEGLTSEKLALLNDDIYNSKMPVQKILTHYKVGNITADDLQWYYGQKVAPGTTPSPELIEGMRTTLRHAAGEGTPQEQLMAKRALELIVRRMQGIRK